MKSYNQGSALSGLVSDMEQTCAAKTPVKLLRRYLLICSGCLCHV